MNFKYHIFVLLILALFVVSCTTGISLRGNCRQEALYSALVAGEKYPVKIAHGKINRKIPHSKYKDNYHSIAMAYKNGQWYYLKKQGDVVVDTLKPTNLTDVKYMDIRTWFKNVYQLQHKPDKPFTFAADD